MTDFALTLAQTFRPELLKLIAVMFWLYVPISFICVARYVARQIHTGRLLNPESAPLPFKVTGVTGWFFILCVLELIFLQSPSLAPYYVALVLGGVSALLLETRHAASQQFGLTRLHPIRLLSWSLLGFGAIMLVETPLTEVIEWLMDAMRLPHPEQQPVETFRKFTDVSSILEFIFEAVILAPLVEELFFRGFLLTFLKNYTSTWLALVLSAGIFAFAHLNLAAALPLWFLGIALGLAYEHTGSLLLPIGIHACWNLVTALSLLLDKGSG